MQMFLCIEYGVHGGHGSTIYCVLSNKLEKIEPEALTWTF